MIIDEIIDTHLATEEWDVMSWEEKSAIDFRRPHVDYAYIKGEAELFGMEDIAKAIHIAPNGLQWADVDDLRQALHSYVERNGYARSVHAMVDELELN